MKRISLVRLAIAVLLSWGVLLSGEVNAIQGQQLNDVSFINSETEPDPEIESAFSEEFGLKRGKDKVRYYYNRVDLNGDGVPEIFVYLTGPLLCGTGGCSGLILECENGGYTVKSRFSLVRTPVFVSETKINGWKDIIMYVAGGGIEASYRVLKFDGKTYPLNPSIQPKVESSNIKGIGIIRDDVTENPGIEF